MEKGFISLALKGFPNGIQGLVESSPGRSLMR